MKGLFESLGCLVTIIAILGGAWVVINWRNAGDIGMPCKPNGTCNHRLTCNEYSARLYICGLPIDPTATH